MALMSLTNGLVWRDSGQVEGFQVSVPANYGTLGSVPNWRRQHYDLAWTRNFRANGPGEPIMPQYNVLPKGAAWRAVANKSAPQQPVPNTTPRGPLNFQPPGIAQTSADATFAAQTAAAAGSNSILK